MGPHPITKDSPEAFEEPIWSYFFPTAHDPRATHRLTAADRQPRFDAFFLEHLRKVLLLRGGNRYVSKGNYNVTRIEYLADLLPDARFVVPVRHPVAHVESLMRQHQLFKEYGVQDARVPHYLRAAGHFEFGTQRVPVNIDAEDARQIAEAWSAGEDDRGYAVMWRSIYSHVCALVRSGNHLGTRITLIRYEDLCQDSDGALRSLLQFCQFEEGVDALLARMPDVSPREPDSFRLSVQQRAKIWDATAEIAKSLGYSWAGCDVTSARDRALRIYWVASLFMIVFAYGVAVGQFKIFPYELLRTAGSTTPGTHSLPSPYAAAGSREVSRRFTTGG